MSSTEILHPKPQPPQIVLTGDSPRVHVSDPETSHMAADKSQATVVHVRDRVLQILADHGPLAAFEVCRVYAARARQGGWPKVHHESPRKRVSELRKEGYLVDTGERRVNRSGNPEIVVALAGAVS